MTSSLPDVIARRRDLYDVYKIPKSKGGFRTITEPREELVHWQELAKDLLDRFPIHPSAHGFVPGRSPVTNAMPHRGSRWVLNMDVKDFFPSTRAGSCMHWLANEIDHAGEIRCQPEMMEGIEDCLGMSLGEVDDRVVHVRVAEILTDLCTLDGSLPQGACTSPALSNIVGSHVLDPPLLRLAEGEGLAYTRYADDLTFSGEDIPTWLETRVQEILGLAGYKANWKKMKRMPWYQRQLVTGIVVNNDTLGISKRWRNELRTRLYRLGAEGKEIDPETRGVIEHVRSVNANQAKRLIRSWEIGQSSRNQPSDVSEDGGDVGDRAPEQRDRPACDRNRGEKDRPGEKAHGDLGRGPEMAGVPA